MANLKASKKDILTTKRNRARNLQKRDEVKALFKNLSRSESTDSSELSQKLNLIYRTLDRVPFQAMTPQKASRLKRKAARIVKEKLGQE